MMHLDTPGGGSVKLCECGCGQPVAIADRHRPECGWTKGQPIRFISGHHFRLLRGRNPTATAEGRARIYQPEHHRTDKKGYVYRYVLVAERALGRPLPKQHPVHHVDEDPSNDAPTNLVICENHQYHTMLHARSRILRMGFDPNGWKYCGRCKQAKPRGEFHRSPQGWDRLVSTCKPCVAAKDRMRRSKETVQ